MAATSTLTERMGGRERVIREVATGYAWDGIAARYEAVYAALRR